ncbi:aldehyde dehydrogenase (NADP(+)) [Aeromicrobium sp. CTD01-1L150]|uniref:aldehyde dehydrogenase (NADP(+)) n=1 Tax=Aeromicrobium sp. CTD01-1L150 TaxID=3341830 RepID=UPI0035C0A008
MTTAYTHHHDIRPLDPALERIVAAADAAAPELADQEPRRRGAALAAVADALEAHAEELVQIAQEETGLTTGRLQGELKRTAVQLRLFADVIVDGSYLDVRIDRADGEFVLGARPDLRRTKLPVGPVVNFAASNFPFAFSVAGGDSAAALAAGCPVIVKAHPGHPRLSLRTGELVTAALEASGMPAGVFSVIEGQEAGTAVLQDPRIRAGAFTGSVRVGRLLADIAASRPQPIPFFGELGSTNPVFVTQQAVQTRADDLVSGFVTSVAGSAGQLCTKPGFVFLPEGHGLEERIVQAVEDSNASLGEQRLLNPAIASGYNARRETTLGARGVRTVVAGESRTDGDDQGWTTPTIVAVSLEELRAQREELLEETFGPFSVLVEVPRGSDLAALVYEFFTGSLTVTLQTGDAEVSDELRSLVAAASDVAGRLLYGGWPTGVAVTPAQQHGGPWPATTNDSSTSVGTAAISRFLRPVAYQSVPDALLPPMVRDANPWDVPQAIDEAGGSKTWGSRASA